MVDRDFGNWLAGFIDGEGCFFITRDSKRGAWRARFSLALRHDDKPILTEIVSATGIGTLHDYKGQSGHLVSRWSVQSRADCEALDALLRKYTLRAKKRADYAVWSEAVEAQKRIRAGRANNDDVKEQMAQLKERLRLVREEGLND